MDNDQNVPTPGEAGNAPSLNPDRYIEQIQKLKAESVSINDYNALMEENKSLINALTEGKTLGGEQKPTVDHSAEIKRLRAKLFSSEGPDINNLEYMTDILDLRDHLMATGQPDPFVAKNSHITPTEESYKTAQRVADGLRHCIDVADGDSGVFNTEYQRIVTDPIIPRKRTK